MRYKEFEEKVEVWSEKYGYETEVEINFNLIDVKILSGVAFQMIAKIRTDLKWALDTDWKSFADIKEDARAELFSIILKLAKTPPAERRNKKRFIIPLPNLITTDGRQQYLTYKDYNFFASRRDETLIQTWKEEHLKLVPEIYREFAVEFDEDKEY